MLPDTLQLLFTRDLLQLRREIESYQNEDRIWKTDKSIANSAGNLCLHLIGNLNAHIGKEIGKTGYVRNRDLEFSMKDVPRKELLSHVDETIQVVSTVLQHLDPSHLSREYPLLISDKKTTVEYMLVHLATHLAYHLGQINYHRRLLDV